MADLLQLDKMDLDALRETANIGAGHAATALSQMTGDTIMITVPTITIAALEDVPTRILPEEEPIVAVLMQMMGDLTGRTLLVFPHPTAVRLAQLMLRRARVPDGPFGELEQSAIKEAGNILSGAYMNALSEFMGLMLRRPRVPDGPFGDLEQSAIKEAGNILSGAYMNALSEFMGLMLLPSPPSLAIDMSTAVLNTAYLQFGTERDMVVAVETQFYLQGEGEELRGFFLLLPDAASLQVILRAVRLL